MIGQNVLNPMQEAAVKIKEGPVLVSAPPGSGKSRIIVYRTARLIDSGIDPESIMVATFTRKAATELKERVGRLLGSSSVDIVCGTFHSTCLQLLRRYTNHDFCVIDEAQARNIVSSLLAKAGVNVKSKDMLLDISYLKAWMVTPQEAILKARSSLERQLAGIYFDYEQSLKEQGLMDFDNILQEFLRRFNEPTMKRYLQSVFSYVMVDEYQDVNRVQGNLIDLISAKQQNIFAVGDVSQAIYGFLGADLNEFNSFPSRYRDCRPVVLDLNYRSTKTIVDASNALVGGWMKPAEGYNKGERILFCPTTSVDEEAVMIARVVCSFRGTTAILIRAGWQAPPIMQALGDKDVKYKVITDARSSIHEEDGAEHLVYLMTMHAAKGLEFDNVLVVGLEEGVLPYKDAEDIDEERRLFYVAITRAKQRLFIFSCTFRNNKIQKFSRFLTELPKNLLERI